MNCYCLSTVINQVICYQIMEVLPKPLMFSGWIRLFSTFEHAMFHIYACCTLN